MIEFGLFQTRESPALPDRGRSSDKIKYGPGTRISAHKRFLPHAHTLQQADEKRWEEEPEYFFLFILIAGPFFEL